MLYLFFLYSLNTAKAQNLQPDSIKEFELETIQIKAVRKLHDIQRLDPVAGTYIFSGKKNEVIDLKHKNIALTEKYGRQIFSKVPGVFVYDMDGTGNQISISTRGLDPHRGWEFNIRKDGVITNSDIYGYPASHYNIPMEAVDRIELVRGTGSLQYGAQFGGMLNYISKLPDSTKRYTFESINTVGSYGLVSTYNNVSGFFGKFRFSAWMNKKSISGYRKNSDSHNNSEAITLFYNPSEKVNLKLEWTHSRYLTRIPGPLTDSMFILNPQMSTRARNYYSPDIHVPSFTLQWHLSTATKFQFISSAVIGSRNSVLFDRPATISDSIVSNTLQYNNRQVDLDRFNSYTNEIRIVHSYKLFRHMSNLSAGIQMMNNNLHRRQQGRGTTGSDFDLDLVTPEWGRNLRYKTNNLAVFAENRWVLARKFSFTTGARMEFGETNMTGTTTYYNEKDLPNRIARRFPLFGAGAQYDVTQEINIYTGFSQAYRPVIFKDIIPQSIYEIADRNLKDANGFNGEIGFRGSWKQFKWDVTAFHLDYKNRIGTLAITDSLGNPLIFRTNTGNSKTSGIELFLQADIEIGDLLNAGFFTATSIMDARYHHAKIRSGSANITVDGNSVESVPNLITRNGLNVQYDKLSLSALYSYTSESFADALNTRVADESGSIGKVPSYQVLDLNLSIRFSHQIKFQLNLNNVLDEKYFTKRPQFYPGPGIWPSDGRTYSATAVIKI